MSDGTGLRDEFLLDPNVTFLNHGSFGACPRAVLERYQQWQRELEIQPVLFLARRLEELLGEARAALGAYVGADPDDLVFVPNATTGVNLVARAVGLREDDEVLTTDLEYGALDLAWQHVCAELGARYVRTPIGLPVASAEEIVEGVWAGVGPQTRVLFLSHHTSSTALTLPVAELCRRARAAGIRTVVDGAHVPGHLPLDLRALDVDYYAGNCHNPLGPAWFTVRLDRRTLLPRDLRMTAPGALHDTPLYGLQRAAAHQGPRAMTCTHLGPLRPRSRSRRRRSPKSPTRLPRQGARRR